MSSLHAAFKPRFWPLRGCTAPHLCRLLPLLQERLADAQNAQTEAEAAAKAADTRAKHLAKQLGEQKKALAAKEKEVGCGGWVVAVTGQLGQMHGLMVNACRY